MNNQRAELGIDGNCGFALLGEDIQSGEAEFAEIEKVTPDNSTHHERYTQEHTMQMELGAKLRACRRALEQLRNRLKMPELSFYFGDSHPYGR